MRPVPDLTVIIDLIKKLHAGNFLRWI